MRQPGFRPGRLGLKQQRQTGDKTPHQGGNTQQSAEELYRVGVHSSILALVWARWWQD